MPTTLTPYLSFNGNTREAFAFYEAALGGKIEAMMRTADMPPRPAGLSGDDSDRPQPGADDIFHASLRLPGGAQLFAGDVALFAGLKGVMLALQYDTTEEANRAFHALSQGGNISMPLAPALWAKTFGMLTDRFGVCWAISGEPVNFIKPDAETAS